MGHACEDFVSRYDQGAPSDGYDDDEGSTRYQQFSGQLQPDQYQQAARESFGRLAPEERVQFGQPLRQQARSQGIEDTAWDEDDNNYQDPGYLSQVDGRLEQQQPGMLGQMMGGGNSNPAFRGNLAGIAASAARRLMG